MYFSVEGDRRANFAKFPGAASPKFYQNFPNKACTPLDEIKIRTKKFFVKIKKVKFLPGKKATFFRKNGEFAPRVRLGQWPFFRRWSLGTCRGGIGGSEGP